MADAGARTEVDWRLVERRQAEVAGGGDQGRVEARHHAIALLGREEDAAIGKLAPGVGPKLSQADGAVAHRQLGDAEALERLGRIGETTGSRRGDERLRQADRAGAQGLGTRVGEQALRPLMMGIARIEMGDEDAGVEDDHSGQSPRSRSSSPGS